MHKESYIYLLANQHNNVLYTGVTSDLIRRVYEHKNKMVAGFTKKYNVDKLIYYEVCSEALESPHFISVIKKSQKSCWSRTS